MGTSGKTGFWNGLANGFFGNTVSTVVEYAYGGSNAELGGGWRTLDYSTNEGAPSFRVLCGRVGGRTVLPMAECFRHDERAGTRPGQKSTAETSGLR